MKADDTAKPDNAAGRSIEPYHIRSMRDADCTRLAEIDRLADRLFLETGIPEVMAIADGPSAPAADFEAMLSVCIVHIACTAAEQPVGLAAWQRLDDDIYLRLLAVDPDHGRRGLGAALLEQTVRAGRDVSARRCALSTFREVPFNQPFYQRHGFVELPLPQATPALLRRFEAEISEGVRPEQRVLMVRKL